MSRFLDFLHFALGSVLVVSSIAGLGAVGYGAYSISILRRRHLASVAKENDLLTSTAIAAVPQSEKLK